MELEANNSTEEFFCLEEVENYARRNVIYSNNKEDYIKAVKAYIRCYQLLTIPTDEWLDSSCFYLSNYEEDAIEEELNESLNEEILSFEHSDLISYNESQLISYKSHSIPDGAFNATEVIEKCIPYPFFNDKISLPKWYIIKLYQESLIQYLDDCNFKNKLPILCPISNYSILPEEKTIEEIWIIVKSFYGFHVNYLTFTD